MPDTPVKPTAQAMKAAEQVLMALGCNASMRQMVAEPIDEWAGRPALLADSAIAEDLASDMHQMREFIGEKLFNTGAIKVAWSCGDSQASLNISTVDIDIDWDIGGIPLEVKGCTHGLDWKARLQSSGERRAKGGYDCIYAIFREEENV